MDQIVSGTLRGGDELPGGPFQPLVQYETNKREAPTKLANGAAGGGVVAGFANRTWAFLRKGRRI